MPNSIITNSIMERKVDFPEFFHNGTGCYCLFCEDIHFNSKDHSIDDFRYAGIEISRKNNTIYRQTRESLFIKMCNTQQEGINKRK